MFNFDDVIESVSGSNRYQILLLSIVMYYSIPSAYVMPAPVFLAATPDSRCRIDPYDNHTVYPNVTNDVINEIFIPWNPMTNSYDRCRMNTYNTSMCNEQNFPQCVQEIVNTTEPHIAHCEDGYIYDYSVFEETIVTEWDLVCDKSMLVAMSSSLYYLGVFLGSVVGGILSDRYGRVFIYRFSALLGLLSGCAAALSSSVSVFVLLRFAVGFLYFPGIVSGFTYAAEISRKKWRTVIGLVYNAIFGAGCMFLSLLAFRWRHWRDLQLAVSLIGFLPAVLLSWFLPKSPRWLCTQGKLSEAKENLELMAKRNSGKLTEKLWEETEAHFKTKQKQAKADSTNPLAELFRRPYTRYMILSNMFVWMITCLVYYGLVLNSGSLPGDAFVNNAAGGLMEMLACLSAIPCVIFIGFTKTTGISLFVASGSCLVSTIVIQLGNGVPAIKSFAAVLAMCGRFGSSLAFGTIYLHTVELFPTAGRTTAFGLSSMAARVGSLFSPFAVQLQYTMPFLTPVIFGITALIAAFLSLTFPDTRGKDLPASFVEAERIFQKHLRNSCVARMCCLPRNRFNKEDEEEKVEFVVQEQNN